jgi:phosphatidylserine/phosphatidylglycerophosphate/cardiolipin synthase-like enzyme
MGANPRSGGLAVLLLASLLPAANVPAGEPLQLGLRGSAQVAFTPGDDAASLIIDAIQKAKRQVLVQAYSLTHKEIAQALVDARQRRIEVQVIADPVQDERGRTSQVAWLAAAGVPVWLDGEHAAAHNKVMVIDSGMAEAVVITGSYNFTHAAQFRNSENLLLLRGNPALVEAYAANWRRHRIHSIPYREGR